MGVYIPLNQLYLSATNPAVLTISIIIVNYNVKFFLEQCLYSIEKATAGMEVEVIVVDNSSTDGSEAYLGAKFPSIKYVFNSTNIGFGKACNQGLGLSRGEYVLFLNPDTLLAEDSLQTCIEFFASHKDAGALGVRMVDGTGAFLKESKRSFPSPMTSLYKLFGLSLIFPHSKTFGRYHLGHLSEEENHEVDVLAGAFMMIPKKVLNEVGAFDEAFFMYGEDVDLSYRIQAAGYKNYYLADTTIIHFKGESTKRGSLNYVRLFYSAMNIFVRKHYGGASATIFRLSIQFAIGVRAAMAAAVKFIRWVGLPLIDGLLTLLCFWMVKEIWVGYVRRDIVLPEELLQIFFPAYTLSYLVVAYYAGLYDKVYRPVNLLRSTLVASIVMLAAYALLPEHLRFSRGILMFGSLVTFIAIAIERWVLLRAGILQEPADKIEKPFILVAGGEKEFGEVISLLKLNNKHTKVIGRVGVDEEASHAVTHIANVAQTAKALAAQELIFSAGTLSYKQIIESTRRMGKDLRLRYHAARSESIVGSDSKSTSGEAISLEAPLNLHQPANRRIKRLMDVAISAALLVTFPVHLLLVKKPFGFIANCFSVLIGQKTWIGYLLQEKHLPRLRKGVLAPNGHERRLGNSIPEESIRMIDYWYAKDYEPGQDLQIIAKNYRWLGL